MDARVQDQSCLVTINSKGTILSVNEKTTKLFGYHKDELLGQNISLLATGDHAKYHDAYIERYMAGGGIPRACSFVVLITVAHEPTYLVSAAPRVLNRVRNLSALRKDGHSITIRLPHMIQPSFLMHEHRSSSFLLATVLKFMNDERDKR